MNTFDLSSFPFLQLFAETGGNTGVTAPDAGVQGVKQDTAADTARLPETVDPDAEFERLIRGQYKDQFNARVQDIVRKRLKSREKTLSQDGTVSDQPEVKSGTGAKDPTAAPEKNDPVAQQLRHQERMTQAKRQYEQWLWQAQQAQQLYPSLDLAQEAQNPRFMELLRSGATVGDAYLVAHRDEIIPAVMQYTARAVEEKLANRIAANGARPSENAMWARGTAVVKDQVSHMSKAQRQDIIRRVRRGEIITF